MMIRTLEFSIRYLTTLACHPIKVWFLISLNLAQSWYPILCFCFRHKMWRQSQCQQRYTGEGTTCLWLPPLRWAFAQDSAWTYFPDAVRGLRTVAKLQLTCARGRLSFWNGGMWSKAYPPPVESSSSAISSCPLCMDWVFTRFYQHRRKFIFFELTCLK